MIWFVAMLWGTVYLVTHSFLLSPLRLLVSTVAKRAMVRRFQAGDEPPLALAWLFTTAVAGMYCEACTGFWIGGLFAALGYWPLETHFNTIVEAAVISSGLMALVGKYGPTGVFEAEQAIASAAINREQLRVHGVHEADLAPDYEPCGCEVCVAARTEREYRENHLQ